VTRRRIPVAVKARIADDLAAVRIALTTGNLEAAWHLLEEAHVLSQPWIRPHVRVHAAMLRAGWRTGDRREVRGQMVRLVVAGPGSLTGRYPLGNTGRARVPAMLPMPMPDELARLLASES
jgi:hypothetical protein